MIFSVDVCVDRLADQFCRARSSLGIAGLVRERHGREIEHDDAGLRFRLEIGVYYDEPDGAWCPEACPVVLARLILEDNCGQLHQHLRDADSRREGECVVRCLNAGNSLWCFAENDASVPIEHTGVECYNLHHMLSAPGATYELRCELRQLLPGENPFWMREMWPPDYIYDAADDAVGAGAVVDIVSSTSSMLAVAAPVTKRRAKPTSKLRKKRTFRQRKLVLDQPQEQEQKAQESQRASRFDDLDFDDIFGCA